jgi:hypothetical protein
MNTQFRTVAGLRKNRLSPPPSELSSVPNDVLLMNVQPSMSGVHWPRTAMPPPSAAEVLLRNTQLRIVGWVLRPMSMPPPLLFPTLPFRIVKPSITAALVSPSSSSNARPWNWQSMMQLSGPLAERTTMSFPEKLMSRLSGPVYTPSATMIRSPRCATAMAAPIDGWSPGT